MSSVRPSCPPAARNLGWEHDQGDEQVDRDHQGPTAHQGEGGCHVPGRTGGPKTLLLSNIQGLMGVGGKSKADFLSDQAMLHNSLAVAVTETWLKPEIKDSEILVKFPGYTLSDVTE